MESRQQAFGGLEDRSRRPPSVDHRDVGRDPQPLGLGRHQGAKRRDQTGPVGVAQLALGTS